MFKQRLSTLEERTPYNLSLHTKIPEDLPMAKLNNICCYNIY